MRTRTDRRGTKDTLSHSQPAAEVAVADETAHPLAVSILDGSKLTNLGRSTLYELMAGGELPYVQIRGRRILLVDDLTTLLRRYRRTVTSR